MVISSVFSAPLVYALDFSVDVPEEVNVDDKFEVKIIADTSDSYDVKIFVYREDKNTYVSQISDSGVWRSPRTYLRGAFPAQERYEIKVVNFTGESELCVRLRKVDTSSFSDVCLPIKVGDGEFDGDGRGDFPIVEEVSKIVIDSDKPNVGPASGVVSIAYVDVMRTRVVYSFIAFCLAVIGLLLFRRL